MLFLDQDPVICATSTPVSLYETTLPQLREAIETVDASTSNFAYKLITYPTNLKELVINDIAYSKRNRDWCLNYYNALAMNFNKFGDVQYPALRCDYIPRRDRGEYFASPLKIHSPTYDENYFELVQDYGEYYKGLDVLDTSRLMLVHLSPTPDEFMFGEPVWLSNHVYQDYVAFDPINKVYIKICRGTEQYRYFISRISNNWKEVHNVPKEIDTIMDCILINRV